MNPVQVQLTIRYAELEIEKAFKEKKIAGTVHLSIGQEWCDVTIIQSFKNPMVFGNHRSHGQYLATTGDVKGLFQQVKIGMSQHLYSPDKFLSHGIQGDLLPVAYGTALAFHMKGIKRHVLAFIGDGTLGEGIVYETLNLLSRTPYVPLTICILDNDYSMSKTAFTPHVPTLARAFDLTYADIGSVDLMKHLIWAKVSRLCGHSCSDTQRYRPEYELTQRWREMADRLYGMEDLELKAEISAIAKEVFGDV